MSRLDFIDLKILGLLLSILAICFGTIASGMITIYLATSQPTHSATEEKSQAHKLRPIKLVRMARVRRGRRSNKQKIVEVDYAMAVQQMVPSNCFQRIGMAVLKRESYLDYPKLMWKDSPSVFEKGDVFGSITIIWRMCRFCLMFHSQYFVPF